MNASPPPGAYSATFLDHVTNPRGQGSLDRPTHRGHAVDASCGDRLWLDLRVDRGVVADARFRVEGCAGSIAVGSVLVEHVVGRKAIRESVTAADLDEALGAVPPSKRHALRLAVETWKAALGAAG